MIQYNQKIFLTNRLSVVEVDYNVKRDVVLSHILSFLCAESIEEYQPINTSQILFITDEVTEHGMNMYKTRILQDFCKSVNVADVSTVSCHAFTGLTESPLDFSNISTVVVGFINVIPPKVFREIVDFFRNTTVIIFGDPNIENQEYSNYFSRYLTNKSLSIKLDYDTGRYSDSKKINNLVMKLRKDSDGLFENTLNNSIDIQEMDVIHPSFILNKLESHDVTVVVPKRLYGDIMSKCYELKNGTSDISLKMGTELYIKRSYLDVDSGVVVPAYTKCVVIDTFREFTSVSHDSDAITMLECTIHLTDNRLPDQLKNKVLRGVLVNITDYYKQFNPNLHPEQYDVISESIGKLNISTSDDSNPALMKVTPFKILTTSDTKYCDTDKMTAFIETIERDIHFSTDTFYYNHFSRVKSELDIFYSDEFEVC